MDQVKERELRSLSQDDIDAYEEALAAKDAEIEYWRRRADRAETESHVRTA